MLYENLLLKTFDNNYSNLIIKQEKLRKDIATMIYCFYTNNKPAINEYIKLYMSNSSTHELKAWDGLTKEFTNVGQSGMIGMFSVDTIKIMPKIHIDIFGKVLDLVCTVYNAGADRYLLKENGEPDETQTELLMNIYNGFNMSKLCVDMYKQGYAFNTILVQPVWRNEKIELDIITPNFCSVTTYDNDYTKLKSVMINKSIDDEDVIVYWSDEYHYYINSNGVKLPITDETGNSNNSKNPLGELPFAVLRFQCSSDFWGEPQQDLIENNIWYDVLEMNKFFVEMFQGLGVGLAINLGKQGIIPATPNTLIAVDKVDASTYLPPSLEFLSTNAPLSELRESIDFFYKRIGNSKGLSSGSMTNEVTEQSGVSKAYDSLELQIKKDSHKLVLKQFEKELFEKIRLVYNYYSDGKKINDKLQFKIDTIEDEPTININDEIAITQFKLDNNMTSIVDLMIKQNPDLTEEEATKQILENKSINEKYLINEKEKGNSAGNRENSSAGSNTGDSA